MSEKIALIMSILQKNFLLNWLIFEVQKQQLNYSTI